MNSERQEIQFCTSSDETCISYAQTGAGPPLVKVANWLSHLEYDWKSPVWRHWLKKLSDNHTLVRYDQRGCGLSDRDVEVLSIEALVDDLEAVIDDIGLDTFPLLGVCSGGPIAYKYARRHPEKVSHLILYASYGSKSPEEYSPNQVTEAKTMLRLIKVGWGRDNPAFRQFFTSLFIPEADPEQIDWYNKLQRISTSPDMAYRIQHLLFNLRVGPFDQDFDIPTLVLHCKNDAVVPFDEGREWAAKIPDAKFIPLESNNHILLENEPAWQRFLDEVQNFLGSSHSDNQKQTDDSSTVFPELTPRQHEVLNLIAQGLNNKEIAGKLYISPKTVSNHINTIFQKLQVENRARAIVLAREAGLGQTDISGV
jgi:pimeloyl-ACP methyl ester carboxylesterase/DNA-binding CsgD family transcriptional regulator